MVSRRCASRPGPTGSCLARAQSSGARTSCLSAAARRWATIRARRPRHAAPLGAVQDPPDGDVLRPDRRQQPPLDGTHLQAAPDLRGEAQGPPPRRDRVRPPGARRELFLRGFADRPRSR
eukprot:634877-Pyramimonas_sp.AAC.1